MDTNELSRDQKKQSIIWSKVPVFVNPMDRQQLPTVVEIMADLSLKEFGGIRVICSRQITGTDLGTVALVISSFTTSTDLVSMVITKCKATSCKQEDFCVVMETGYKDKGGGLETKVLGDEDHPLEMQAQKPKGQVRFGVQPRNGIVVKVYDGRVWPVVLFGDVYITTEFTTQLVIHHLLSSALPKKQLTKYTLALGSSHGKIHRFLSDVEQPVRVLQDPRAQAGGDLCFLIVKKPKAAKKHMFRSLSWASISKLGQGQPMSHPDGVFQNDGKKQKKYRLKKKKDGRGVSTESLATSDSTSSEEHVHLGENLTSRPIKRANSSYANGHRKVNGHSKENGHPVLIASASDGPLRSKTFSLSGMPQNSSLTSFYSCDNVSVAAPPNNINTDSESELSSTEAVDDKMQRQPPKYSEHTGSSRLQEQREAEDTLSDLQVVLRTRSLGDLTANQTMSLAPEHSGLRESWLESSDRPRYIHSAGSTRTVTVNPPAAKRDVPRQRPTRQNRRSCVARIEDKENRDYLEDYCGRTLQKTPRQRRSLPQIPNNEIDDKKRHLAELMMRRLTVCNGEIATYLQDGRLTGSLNEIRDGRYISSAHIHLTPSDSLNSQLDESPPSDRDFDSGNGYRESPVQIISSPRSPHSVISQNYGQHNVRRRTPDPFTASPKMQRMPQIQERDTAHTPLTRIAKSDSHLLQYQVPRSRAALIEAERDAHFNNDVPPSYQNSVGAPRYQGNAPSYFRTSPPGGAPRNRPVFRTNGYQGSGVLNYPSSVSTHYGTLPRGPQTNYVPCSLGEVSSYSTLPRPDKSGSDQRNSQRIPIGSPSKTHSENSNDSGSLNVASRGSMVDSGYGTNGESDYGGVSGRPLQPQKIYPAERQGILKQRSDDFKKANGSFERIPLQSSPDPVTSNPAPSLHQLLSVCSIHASKLAIPNNKLAANLIQIHEDSINLPQQKDHSSGNSPKGKCSLSLGGPGSAFRRVKNNSRDLKCYNLVSVEKIEKVCQPKQTDGMVEKGDFLIEINGHSTLGLDFSSVLSVLEAHQGGQLEVVVARKKPVERVQETLTTEISKLRQQCAYLITEVKSKERIITDLSSVGSGEITPPPVQNLTLDSPMPRQDTYYTCELSEDEFIV